MSGFHGREWLAIYRDRIAALEKVNERLRFEILALEAELQRVNNQNQDLLAHLRDRSTV